MVQRLYPTGASDSATLGRGAFQDLDHVALARPICEYVELVTRPERIPQAMHEAFAAATSARPGPVHLTIPVDVLNAEADDKSQFSTWGQVISRAMGDASQIEAAALNGTSATQQNPRPQWRGF